MMAMQKKMIMVFRETQQNSESSTVPVGGCFVWFNAPGQLAQLQRNTSETTVGKGEDEE